MKPDKSPNASSISRRLFVRNSVAAAAGVGLSGVALHQWATRIELQRYVIERVEVPIAGLAEALDGFRIVQLSDFHLSPPTTLEYIERIVAEAAQLNPDLVVLTGDFVLRSAEAIFDLAPAVAALNPRHGLWACLGNHDYWQGVEVVTRGLARHQLSLLKNSGNVLTHDGASLYLAGVDDAWEGVPDVVAALSGLPDGMTSVLLAHEPDPADNYCRDTRITLQLSGHSHGGQVRFPLIGSPFCPRMGRKYDQGLYRVNQSWLYTNRGLGVTVPVRFNCRPEITELTLRRAATEPAKG